MKKTLFLFLMINCTLHIDNCFSQWVQVSSGMGNITVSALTTGGNNIYAGGTNSGVYVTTNNGSNWTQTSLNNQLVFALASNGNTIFAGTFNAGIFYSTNGGTNWSPSVIGSNMTVWAFAINGNSNFAGTFCPVIANMGVYLSTNSGTAWNQIGVNNREVRSMAINGSVVYAGTIDSGVYVSTNNGISWVHSSLNNKNVRSMTVNGANVFAGCLNTNGVYKSANNGANWTQTSLNNRDIGALTINGNNIFAGSTQYGFYVSNDNGASWTQRNEGMGNQSIYSFCILNDYIYAGTSGNGVYRRPLNELLGILPISSEVPNTFSLSQNYPNPFNPVTKIKFDISGKSAAQTFLSVYDILGREVAVLVNEELRPGIYEVDFYGSGFTSGVYFYKLVSADYSETKSMVLIK